MKVKIIRATIAQKRQVMPGDFLDVSQQEAVLLIGAGKAQAVKEAAETTSLPTGDVEQAVKAAAANSAPPPAPPQRNKRAGEGRKKVSV